MEGQRRSDFIMFEGRGKRVGPGKKEVHNGDRHCGARPVDCHFQDYVVGD